MSRVGVFFNARREQGGLYQYAATLVDCLTQFASVHEYVLINATLDEMPWQPRPPVIDCLKLPFSAVRLRWFLEVLWMQLARRGYHGRGWVPQYPAIRAARLEAMLYVKPGIHSFYWRYPAIFPIHDLQHRLQPRFPEVSAGGELQRREYIYRHAIPAASGILTDSQVGKEDVVNLYDADARSVHPLPYLASTAPWERIGAATVQSTRERYRLPERYFFYPAAFWQHKNHARIIEAVRLLREEGVKVHLVLSGGLRHEYANLALKVATDDLGEQVHFLGYVPDEHLPVLYQCADGLVMPTFFGPTNIPVLEAWTLGCPVISSDIRGIREQVGDAGILVDPNEEHQIANAMKRLYVSTELRQSLVRKGARRVAQWTPAMFAERLEHIIGQALSPGSAEP